LKIYTTPEEWIKENQDLLSGESVKFKINSKNDLPEEFKRRLTFRSSNGSFTTIYPWGYIFSRITKEQKIILDNRIGIILVSEDSIKKDNRFHGAIGCSL